MQRCSNRAYAKCPTRHLCGPIEEADFTEDSECAEFNREVESQPMTNGDKIRAMSDEELARVLCSVVAFTCDLCEFAGTNTAYDADKCLASTIKWLQWPAEGE